MKFVKLLYIHYLLYWVLGVESYSQWKYSSVQHIAKNHLKTQKIFQAYIIAITLIERSQNYIPVNLSQHHQLLLFFQILKLYCSVYCQRILYYSHEYGMWHVEACNFVLNGSAW